MFMIKDIKQILVSEFQLIPAGICLYLIFHYWLYLLFSVLGLLLIFFTFYFFRNPERAIPEGKNYIVSPADGKVMRIQKEDNVPYLNGEANRVDIFLSLFDVHVNRIPMAGTIEFLNYQKGKYYPAMLPKSSELNEKMMIGLQNNRIKILFTQIAGTIARRIVCDLAVGDYVKTGAVFGMIRFGSCVQIFLPFDIKLNVKTGDRLKSGESILGEFYDT